MSISATTVSLRYRSYSALEQPSPVIQLDFLFGFFHRLPSTRTRISSVSSITMLYSSHEAYAVSAYKAILERHEKFAIVASRPGIVYPLFCGSYSSTVSTSSV